MTLSRFLAEAEKTVAWGLMYPRLRGIGVPPSDLPETEDTEDAVETERSRGGRELMASVGEASGEGDEARS